MLVVPRVFVSSTKEDLADYRAALASQLPRLNVVYCGMELFGSRSEAPIATMFREIRRSDLFVGILGHSYGSEDANGTSFTELEYGRAKDLGRPTLMFIIHASVPFHKDHKQSRTKKAKLDAFKQRVRAQTVEEFRSQDDLVFKVYAAIERWLKKTSRQRSEILVAAALPKDDVRRNLRNLYSSDDRVVVAACRALSHSRHAIEHFYALLRLRSGSDATRDAVFEALAKVPADCLRVEQILEEMMDDGNSALRYGAAVAICNRARAPRSVVPRSLAEAVLRHVTDESEKVKAEVAHALPKIAARREELRPECVEALKRLAEENSSKEIQSRVASSQRDMAYQRDMA